MVEEVRQKVERLALPKSKSVKTVLVYDGELDPSVEEDDFFDYLIPAEKLILFTDDKKIWYNIVASDKKNEVTRNG